MEDTLALPAKQRASLAHRLIVSLDRDAGDDRAAELWVSEIERRARAVDDGSIELQSWQTVRDHYRKTRQ